MDTFLPASDLQDRLREGEVDEVADELEKPQTGTKLCREHGPREYIDLLEDTAARLDEQSQDCRARRLRLLARSVRLDGTFLHQHPDRLPQTVYNKLRWFGEQDRYSDPFIDWAGHCSDVRMEQLLTDWREACSSLVDGPWLLNRRIPRDLPSERFDSIFRTNNILKKVCWGPTGETVFGASMEPRVFAWNRSEFECLWSMETTGSLHGLGFCETIGALVVAVCDAPDETSEEHAVEVLLLDPVNGQKKQSYGVRCTGQPGGFSVSRQGTRVVVGGADVPVLIDLETGESRPLVDHDLNRATTADSGQTVVFSDWDRDHLEVVDLDGRSAGRRLEPNANPRVSSLAVHGDRAVSAHPEGVLSVWDVERGKLEQEIFTAPADASGLSFSGNGNYLALSWSMPGRVADYHVAIWDLDSGEVVHRLCGGPARANDVAFAPDGQLLAMACTDGHVRVLDLDQERLGPRHRDPGSRACAAALDPGNNRAAVGGPDLADPVLVLDLERNEVEAALEFDDVPRELRFSDDGRHLVVIPTGTTEGTRLWVHADGSERETSDGPRTVSLSDCSFPRCEVDLQDQVDPETGMTQIRHPTSAEPIPWPLPLHVMGGLDALYVDKHCRYVLSHQSNRLELLEVRE